MDEFREREPYQRVARETVLDEFTRVQSTLIELATGTGKTEIAIQIAAAMPNHRTLLAAPFIPLVGQAARKVTKRLGVSPAIEQGINWANESPWAKCPFVVASKQSLCSNERYKRFEDIGLLILDEAHYAPTPAYLPVIEWFKRRGVKVLGMTATAKRHDKVAMKKVFDTCCYQYGIVDAVADGWLVGAQTRCVTLESLDLSNVGTVAGDFNGGELAGVLEDEKVVFEIADVAARETYGRKTAIYCKSVDQAQAVAERLADNYQIRADWICCKTTRCSPQKREEVLRSFTSDHPDAITHVCNVGILCLDEKTEVLTETGWVGIDDATPEHKYANWTPSGEVFFGEGAVVRRERLPEERMAVLNGKRLDVRITEGHDVICRSGNRWRKQPARELVGKRKFLPVSGHSQPVDFFWPEPYRDSQTLVTKTAYNLRTYNGYEHSASRAEATRRIEQRLRRSRTTQPKELSLSECAVLGFWAGDGSASRGRYSATQATCYPKIIEWFEKELLSAGIGWTKTDSGQYVTWHFRTGLGGGDQEREGGMAHLKRYFQKNEFPWIAALDKEQFDSFLHGLWMADGDHGQGIYNPKRTMRISGVNRALFDALQSVAPVRGYRVNMVWKNNGPRATQLIGQINLRKVDAYTMGNERFRFEEGWKQERVWCVTVRSGALITRRNGKVMVLGNCTGWDFPGLECLVMARPTKSTGLYTQIFGRGTRPLEGVVDFEGGTPESRKAAIAGSRKPFFFVVDLVDNSLQHRIVTSADVLGGKMDVAVIERVKKDMLDGKARDVNEALLAAKKELDEEREEEERKRRAAIEARAKYRTHDIDPLDRHAHRGAAVRTFKRVWKMPSGKYRNTPLIHIPSDYLEWVAGDPARKDGSGSVWRPKLIASAALVLEERRRFVAQKRLVAAPRANAPVDVDAINRMLMEIR